MSKKFDQQNQTILTTIEIQNELSKIRIEEHSKSKHCNKISGIPYNIFLDSPIEIINQKHENLSPILIRKQTQSLMNEIQEGSRKKNLVLYGGNGTGKSYTLFHLACYFSSFHPWNIQKKKESNKENLNSNLRLTNENDLNFENLTIQEKTNVKSLYAKSFKLYFIVEKDILFTKQMGEDV
ncbi:MITOCHONDRIAL 28S ribosomal protein S29 [Anaeramoeba ignava]|uniref:MITOCHONDRIAL 28S ribosomal protein S29 n=1 Tax=Anaeramoeba ignava TaxID=1746090 RepID=A0A9Q0L7J3_ANAIG|nr:MITOCHONDRIAL 28S ribosomal protein S29 [Anaeramoeba ignava]